MVDAQANIRVDLDVAQALADLKLLEKQIQFFNKNIIQGSAQAKNVQNEFNSSLLHNINATGKFTASMGKIHTETERFTNALEKNKLSAREYFRYSMASTKSFGRLFGKEFGTITKVAEERVKELQARHIELGRAADGAMRSVKILPKSLDYSKASTSMQIAIQKQQIFNKLLDTGTTKLLNFGKNTQWAGRQLMVGFTIPLSILGTTAIRTFKDMETQAIRFKKVYGDIFTSTAETDVALQNVKKLAIEFTKYGVSVTDTIKMAADAAAAGNSGQQLENVIKQATKLSVLGGVAQDQALDATIAIQNAFGATGKELDKTINFLNAVENQTVVALDDITQAIPKVAPVIKQLGGDIEDLAFFMAAMQEGGVKASEAANALKSGLASLINPSKAASKQAAELGINLNGIVESNAGDLRATVMTFATALQPLDDLSKSRLIETIFGKYQFARLSALFENVTKSGTQASRVLNIAAASTEELGIMAERELGITANSSAVKFAASVEKLKASLVPVGQAFAEALTPIIEFATKALEKFNSFSDGTKKAIVTVLSVIGGIGPVLLMSIGLIGNGLANIGKGINLLRKGYQNIVLGSGEVGNATNYMTMEQLEALSVANNLHNAHEILTNQFVLETGALLKLTTVYKQAAAAATAFATANPGMVAPGTAKRLKTPKFGKPMADGGWVPGTGNKDSVPTVLMPGEFVVTKDAAQANSQTLEQMNKGGKTYRAMGTPSFGKITYRQNPSGPGYDKIPQSQTVDKRDYAHVSKKQLLSKELINELLQDETKLNESAKQRLSIASIDRPLGIEDMKKFALDVGIKIPKNATYDQLEKEILRITKTNNLKESREIYSKNLGAYTSEVTDLNKQVQSNMTARGSKTVGTTTVGQLVDDISRNRFTFSAGLYEGILKDRTDLTQKEKISIMRNIAKKTERSLLINHGRKHIISEDEFARIYREAQEKTLDEKLGKKSQTRIEIQQSLEKQRNSVTALRYKGENTGAIFEKNYARSSGLVAYNQFEKLRSLRPQILSALGKVDNFRRYLEPKISKVTTRVPPKVGRFGAAAGLGVVGSIAFGAAAQAINNRSGGTPTYGEQGVTPAMLTPGEFVVNSQSAQQFGPQLQAMNQGGVAYRQNPSGPGYDPVTPEAQKYIDAYTQKLNEIQKNNPGMELTENEYREARKYAENVAPEGTASGGGNKKRKKVLKEKTSKFGKAVLSSGGKVLANVLDGGDESSNKTGRKYEKVLKQEIDQLLKQGKSTKEINKALKDRVQLLQNVNSGDSQSIKLAKAEIKENKKVKKQQLASKMGTASGIGFGISGAAMAVGMFSKDEKTQQTASTISNLGFALSGLLGIIPMLMNPMVGMTTALIGIPAALFLMKKSVDNAREKAYDFAKSMSNTSSDLKAMGEMTGNVSRSEIEAQQKQSRVGAINPLKSDFGDTFIASDLGKKLLSQATELGKDNMGPGSGQVIGTKLADYVVEGLIDPAQAQSIAQAIGTSLGSQDISANINGKLQEIIGINGNDLYKDPLEVRLRLVEESTNQAKKFFDSIPDQTDKILKNDVQSITGFVNSWKDFMKTGKPDIAKIADFMVSAVSLGAGPDLNFAKRRDFAKIAGQQVGINSTAMESSKKALETYNQQTEETRKEYVEKEKILRNAIKNTKSTEEQKKLQKQLNDLLHHRNLLEEKYINGRKEITAQQKETLDFVMKTFTENEKIQDQMLLASEESVTNKYKDTPLAGLASAFTSQTQEFKNKEVAFLINTEIASGNLGLEQSMSLLNIMTGKDGKLNEEGIQKQITLYAEAEGVGIAGLDRILVATREVQDRFDRGETINLFRDLDPAKFDKASSFLETATNLSDKDVNMDAVIDTVSIDDMVEASDDIAKMNKELPDKITKEALITFAESDSDFAGLTNNVDWFDSLPDEQTKYAIQIYRTIFETIDADKMRTKLENQKKASASSSLNPGMSTVVTDEEVFVAVADEAVRLTKKYFGPGSLYASVLGGEEEGGAGDSPNIRTEQLIALRLLGLDPAVLSQLDYTQAADILNQSAKNQKNIISNLNKELRTSAIRAYALKSAEQVLEDQIDSTSNAIGSYINMLESTRVKPVQDQIDKYTELTNKQQEQVDKYQKGLTNLSKKEIDINKTYDSRVSAIDKVTQANDRAAQRQQKQINLASAIASGDFGEAAGAAAEIANAEAQVQLEDTKTALESQRQNDLKNLTVEINGILYTRETIENNISTINEEIYQRTLLIKAEEQKIADIQKTITAEKEKQRKLQVLSQISQLSTQMQTTVDQTQRQAMAAQIGYLGQSVGLDPNSPESITNLSNQLGINAQALVDNLAKSQQVVGLTASEFVKKFEEGEKLAGKFSKAIDETSVQGKLSLSYMTSLQNAWAGDEKKGVAGLVSTGTTIKDTLIGAGASIVAGKKALDDALAAANVALANAKAAANAPKGTYNPITKKWEAAFGGVAKYMGGGKVNKYAMGGNVNYKGSTEPAPVKMSIGNIVPGLGNTDRIPALLTPGEFVVRKSVAQENLGLLQAMNGDVFPSMKGGIGANTVMAPVTNTVMEGSTTLYNNSYSVNVNVAGTNSSADEVANVVIRKIKGINDRGIRGSRY